MRDRDGLNYELEESEDPLFLKADQSLLALSNQLSDNNYLYHPHIHRYPFLEYKKFIFVDIDSEVLCTRGRKKYEAAWNLLAKVLDKWSIDEFMEGAVEQEYLTHDYYGEECYIGEPAIFNRNIVLVDEENKPFDIVPLQFCMTLIGARGKPEIKEFAVNLGSVEAVSLLQGVFDLLGSKICLMPTDSCVHAWENYLAKERNDEKTRNKKTIESFFHLIDDGYSEQDLMLLYKNLPRLPYGSGLKRFISGWLDGDLSRDLELEKWLLGGRSEEIYKFFIKDNHSLKERFEEMLGKIPQHNPLVSGAMAGWSPIYINSKINKRDFEKELEWFRKLKNNT